MPTDPVALANVRQVNELYAAGYAQNLAATIVAMLPDDRDEARRVLAIAHAILSLELPPPSEDVPFTARSASGTAQA
jgi:hypothetical protein